MAEKLNETGRAELQAAGWEMVPGRYAVQKSFVFRNFIEAFGWMTKVALHAEKLNHHPEWSNVYKRVEVVLTTHDADGLTELDLKLARVMDREYAPRP